MTTCCRDVGSISAAVALAMKGRSVREVTVTRWQFNAFPSSHSSPQVTLRETFQWP